jgi:hypothetical protein
METPASRYEGWAPAATTCATVSAIVGGMKRVLDPWTGRVRDHPEREEQRRRWGLEVDEERLQEFA